ncbi:MAG TPA: RtcB family protein [Anaerolineae bacterium]|nr:RtcB family protein [Anaerolineae bacterium]
MSKSKSSSAEDQIRTEPIPYQKWGAEMVDQKAVEQIDYAARLPIARAAALMPDAHVGYGLPIGGVLATENTVIPYAVGVDIACRMRLSICEPIHYMLDQKSDRFTEPLLSQTQFGVGASWSRGRRADHAVMTDPIWDMVSRLESLYDTAWEQLGTSGSGNHFVEWGVLSLLQEDEQIGLEPGNYLALLSHSGSRGLGARTADYYSKLAKSLHPDLPKEVSNLAWLDLDSEEGQEYWLAMTLAGRYAAANHAIIHERVLTAAGLQPLAHVENHHNYAWKETLDDGTEVIVHRKGATPAGAGVLGVIPGSMGDPGYVVRGRGNGASINSAAHGAGRQMGRGQAFRTLDRGRWQDYLKERRVTLLGGSLDESPEAYKPIDEVMMAQSDLVETVAKFTPRIVRMADERPRDKRRRKKKERNRRQNQ